MEITTTCRADLESAAWLNCCDGVRGAPGGAALGFWGPLGRSDGAEAPRGGWHGTFGPLRPGDRDFCGVGRGPATRSNGAGRHSAWEKTGASGRTGKARNRDSRDLHVLPLAGFYVSVLSCVFRVRHAFLLYFGEKDLIEVIKVPQNSHHLRCSAVSIGSSTCLNSILHLIRKPKCSSPLCTEARGEPKKEGGMSLRACESSLGLATQMPNVVIFPINSS